MNKKTLIMVALIVMVAGILPLGTQYAAGLMEINNQGKAQVPEGTEVYHVYQLTLDQLIYLPLIEYNLPLVSTPTPTPTSLPNEVVINQIEPGKLNDEYVRVKNRTTQTVDITGWTIKAKESGKTYTFPKFYLDPNDAVTVWTKGGINEDMDLYWGLTTEVWDDKDDCGRLGDEHDELLFWYCYSSSTPEAPTPTSQPIPDVIINKIEPGDYYDEYVRVKNRTTSKVDLTGWRIKSISTQKVYIFPKFTLKPDAAVYIWSQTDINTDTDLYWHSTTQLWDDKKDCARLGNDDDELVDYYCYP